MNRKSSQLSWNPINWVVNSLNPDDLRTDKPIATSRYASFNITNNTEVPGDWKRPVDLPVQFFSRHHHQNKEAAYWRMFCPASKCREWSTLREMSSSDFPHHQHDSSCGDNGNTYRKLADKKTLLTSQCGGRHPQTYSRMTK